MVQILITVSLAVSLIASNNQIRDLVFRTPNKNTEYNNNPDTYLNRNGQYVVSADYEIPYGYIEPMTVSVTLLNDRVVSSTVAFNTVNLTSEGYQRAFENLYRTRVTGRTLNNIELSRIGGASLTSEAFNQALQNIKSQASTR